MRRIIALLIIGLIIVTNIPALSEVTKGELDKLTDSERSSLRSTVDIACFASKGSTKSSYSTSVFDIDLSSLSADELESIKDYLNGKTDDNPSYANASVESIEKSKYAVDISASYILWADIFGLEDVRTDFYITPEADENNHKIIYEDDIAIEYDNQTLYATKCTLFYIWNKDSASDMTKLWKKAVCFYCAIEYGSPLSQNVDKDQSMENADKYFENMNEVMFHRSDEFYNGRMWIPFHTGKQAMYYLGYLEDEKQWLIMAIMAK